MCSRDIRCVTSTSGRPDAHIPGPDGGNGCGHTFKNDIPPVRIGFINSLDERPRRSCPTRDFLGPYMYGAPRAVWTYHGLVAQAKQPPLRLLGAGYRWLGRGRSGRRRQGGCGRGPRRAGPKASKDQNQKVPSGPLTTAITTAGSRPTRLAGVC